MIKKSTFEKYQLVNVAIELNQVNIRDANLPLFVNEFFEEFVGCVIFFLIDFFLYYNHVELDEESQNFKAFIPFSGLMQMITLFQDATNFIAQFV